MSKSNNYKAGQKDGRAGFGPQSSNQEYCHGYRAGQQEYDYWNDKNLYRDLRNDDGAEQSQVGQSADPDDARVGLCGGVWVDNGFCAACAAFYLARLGCTSGVLGWCDSDRVGFLIVVIRRN